MTAKQNQSVTSRVRELLNHARSLDEEAVSSHETEDVGGEAQRFGGATGGIDEVDLQVMPLNYAVKALRTKCDMSSEVDRLATFKKWPNESPMNPTTLAKAGFFYVGSDDMVKCFLCNGKIKDWEFGDSAIGEHKRFFPKCKFVQERDQQNQPLLLNLVSSKEVKSTAEGKSSKKDELYNPKKDTLVIDKSKIPDKLKSEYRRLLTFQYWPRSNPIQPHALAKAGFYYTQTRDVVKCFACNGEISVWKVMNIPMTQHQMLFPECPFVQGEDAGNEKLTTTDVMNAQHAVVYPEPSTKLPPIQKNKSKIKGQVSQMAKVTDQCLLITRRRPLTRAMAQHSQCENEAERLKRFNDCPSSAPEAPFPARFTGIARPPINLSDQSRDNEEEPMENSTTATRPKRKLIKDDVQVNAGTKTFNVDGTTSKRMLKCDEPSYVEEPIRNATNLKRKLIEDDAQAEAGTKTLIVDGTTSNRKSEEAFLPVWVEEILEKERNYLKCKICFERDVNVVFMPCQHLVICTQCECPTLCFKCKKPIETCIKGYW